MRSGRNNVWVTELGACASAFQFLTRLPVRMKLDYTDELFRRSTVYYPVVGLVLGAMLAAAAWLLELLLPSAPTAVIVLGLWVAVTGALHLDGLMDSADGLLSHRSRERMLEIMKDSRVGAMGVVAGVLMLLMKFSLLVTMAAYSDKWLAFLIVAPMWGRWFIVWAIAGWPYAREGQGLGSLFISVTRSQAQVASLPAIAGSLVVLLAFRFPWWEALGYTAGLVVIAGALGYALARSMARKLGGLTGDTYGALVELLECAVLLLAVVAMNW